MLIPRNPLFANTVLITFISSSTDVSTASASTSSINLTLYFIMLKNGQTYFKNLAVFTPQDF